jgi:hypothetical protein
MAEGLNVGDVFLLTTPPNDKHLFVIIAPAQNGKYLCVNVTSKRDNSDTSCILQQSDHPFVRHDSVINYKKAREVDPALIQNQINRGNCQKYQPVSSKVLNRIQQGGLSSTRLKNKYKNYLNSFLNSPQPLEF